MSANGADLPFTKLVATGNDFIFVDARKPLPAGFGKMNRAELARRICDRHFGVGADGAVFVEESGEPGLLKWDFYNSDGSVAEMCGNATRCMGRWAQRFTGSESVRFLTIAGVVRARIEGSEICSELSFVTADMTPLHFSVAGVRREAMLVNTGVPHAVIEVPEIADQARHIDEIRALRFHPDSGPRGANVTFLKIHGPQDFSTVTFERGVEGFTLSCGTGVMAAAAVGLKRSGAKSASLRTPGGKLEVFYGENLKGVVLKGPAALICEGEVSEGVLL